MDVEVRTADISKGKAVFAKRAFEKGSIIFEEYPLVSCQFSWNEEYQYKACHHCLRPLETAQENARRLTGKPDLELPFLECCTTDTSKFTSCSFCGVQYCSLECQIAAYNKYHRTLCLQTTERNHCHPLEELNDAWKRIHLPPETNSIMLVVQLLALIIQSPNRDLTIEQILQFCHRTVNEQETLAHNLLGSKFSDQQENLLKLLIKALPHEGIEQFLTFTGFQSLLALIGTNGQGVGTSAIAQWVTKTSDRVMADNEREVLDKFIDKLYDDMDTNVGNFLNNEGVALFTLQSACNHSCVPNAESTFLHNNNKLSLVALRDIQQGEEIVVSYLDECNLERSRHSRRKMLMQDYIFCCQCPKCQQQIADPDCTSEEDDEDERMSE